MEPNVTQKLDGFYQSFLKDSSLEDIKKEFKEITEKYADSTDTIFEYLIEKATAEKNAVAFSQIRDFFQSQHIYFYFKNTPAERSLKDSIEESLLRLHHLEGFNLDEDASKNDAKKEINDLLMTLKMEIEKLEEDKKKRNSNETKHAMIGPEEQRQQLQGKLEAYLDKLIKRLEESYTKLTSSGNLEKEKSPVDIEKEILKTAKSNDHLNKLLNLYHVMQKFRDPDSRKKFDVPQYFEAIKELELARDEVIAASSIVQKPSLVGKIFGSRETLFSNTISNTKYSVEPKKESPFPKIFGRS